MTAPAANTSDPAPAAEITHRYHQLDQVRLHCAEAGPTDGPVAILLHGFPEFWYSWRHQIPALAEAGFRVVVPDLRGYGLSDKPSGVANYTVELLAGDVAQLVRAVGAQRATVVGHDWGGMVAWWFAMLHPEHLQRLTIMNCPHPGHQLSMMTSLQQLKKSWYMLFFQLPRVPERMMEADDFKGVRRLFRREPQRDGAFSDEDIERYVEAFRGGATTTMMNYYRALIRRSPWTMRRKLRPVDAPTQVIWGAGDRHLGIEFAEPPAKWVWDLRLDIIDDASHWVQVDRPNRVNDLLVDFVRADAGSDRSR